MGATSCLLLPLLLLLSLLGCSHAQLPEVSQGTLPGLSWLQEMLVGEDKVHSRRKRFVGLPEGSNIEVSPMSYGKAFGDLLHCVGPMIQSTLSCKLQFLPSYAPTVLCIEPRSLVASLPQVKWSLNLPFDTYTEYKSKVQLALPIKIPFPDAIVQNRRLDDAADVQYVDAPFETQHQVGHSGVG